MATIINEHHKKSDESVEVVELQNGNIWSRIKDGEVIMFASLEDYILYNYMAEPTVARKYCNEEDLMELYENATCWYDIPLPVVN